jgi:flagellar basal-body rod protein FlgB
MDITKLNLYQMMRANLTYLGERQDVLSQNIANANTPGYVPKDLKPLDFQNLMSSMNTTVQVATTNSKHMHGTKENSSFGRINSSRMEMKPSGNKVVLEDQIMQASKNSAEYQKTTNIYRKMIEMIKTSIGNV